MAEDNLPMLEACQKYEGDDIRAGMVALALMGHSDELIEFLEERDNEQSELYAAKKSRRDPSAQAPF
jgi:hypothetical protein